MQKRCAKRCYVRPHQHAFSSRIFPFGITDADNQCIGIENFQDGNEGTVNDCCSCDYPLLAMLMDLTHRKCSMLGFKSSLLV